MNVWTTTDHWTLTYDILDLPEPHNTHNKNVWGKLYWITSEHSKVDDNDKYMDGVDILFSQRFSSRILTQGAVGSRIVWVRLDGPVCSLFVVCVYIPHKYKNHPCEKDVIEQLGNLLSNYKYLKPTDCVIVMRNVQGYTGRWLMNKRPDDVHSADIMTLKWSDDLFTVDILFRPERKYMFNSKKKRICNVS